MKKYLVLFIFACLFSACSNEKKESNIKNDQKELYTQQAEFHKKYSAIKIVEHKDNAVDAFGNPLYETRWYALSNETRVIFPIIWRYGSQLYNFERWSYYYQHKMEIERTTIFIISKFGSREKIKVDLLLLGEKELFLYPEVSASSPYALIHANIK